jgi:hypothetical protein
MNININIIDQRVRKLAEQYETHLQQQLKTNKTLTKDKHFFISTTFVVHSDCFRNILEKGIRLFDGRR